MSFITQVASSKEAWSGRNDPCAGKPFVFSIQTQPFEKMLNIMPFVKLDTVVEAILSQQPSTKSTLQVIFSNRQGFCLQIAL